MKKTNYILVILHMVGMGILIPFHELKAQKNDIDSPLSVNIDFYSSYVWRGTLFSGPSVQPSMSWQHHGLSIGAWASQDFAETYKEADLFVSYSLRSSLRFGITDYYYPGLDYSATTGSHAYEINLDYDFSGR